MIKVYSLILIVLFLESCAPSFKDSIVRDLNKHQNIEIKSIFEVESDELALNICIKNKKNKYDLSINLIRNDSLYFRITRFNNFSFIVYNCYIKTKYYSKVDNQHYTREYDNLRIDKNGFYNNKIIVNSIDDFAFNIDKLIDIINSIEEYPKFPKIYSKNNNGEKQYLMKIDTANIEKAHLLLQKDTNIRFIHKECNCK